MSDLINISVNRLYPHPDNPRKELGDLTELSDSIKVNGVLQNLTVVPKDTGTYTVIIGHRRLAAAKLAGIPELPCTVVEMDLLEQRRTMLMENMQRQDLTPYEQAKGFQMMMDLGATAAEIARDTGFSESTIKQRIRWSRFDEATFEKVSTRQISITDLNRIAEIEDEELKCKALSAIGTKNFESTFTDALQTDKFQKKRAEWIEALETFATQVDKNDWNTMEYVVNFSKWSSEKTVEVPEDKDTVKYFYTVDSSSVSLYREKVKKEATPEEIANEAEKRELEEKEKKIGEELTALKNEMYMKRINFLKKFSPKKTELSKLVAYSADMQMKSTFFYNVEINIGTFSALTGLDFDGYDAEDNMEDVDEEDFPREAYVEAVKKHPELMLFYQIYSTVDDARLSYADHRWNSDKRAYIWMYKENAHLDIVYELLEKLGYEKSDIETQLADGTYEAYGKLN